MAGAAGADAPAVAVPAIRTKQTGLPAGGIPTTGVPAEGVAGDRVPEVGTRLEASLDRGLLTIVKSGESEGQQVCFDGQWVDVPALPSALLCYVGPVLERLTQGHYVWNAHRLSLGGGRDRPSLSFAFEPGSNAVLAPVAGVRPRLGSAGYSRYALAARC